MELSTNKQIKVEKSTKIKLRMLQVAKNKSISYEKFFNDFGTSYSNFKGKSLNSSLRSEVLVDFSAKHPDIDLHWLITGEHKKAENYVLNEPSASYKKPINDIDLLGLSKRLDIVLEQNNEIIQKLDRNIALDIIKEETKKMKS